jgi:hypothetical protein
MIRSNDSNPKKASHYEYLRLPLICRTTNTGCFMKCYVFSEEDFKFVTDLWVLKVTVAYKESQKYGERSETYFASFKAMQYNINRFRTNIRQHPWSYSEDGAFCRVVCTSRSGGSGALIQMCNIPIPDVLLSK